MNRRIFVFNETLDKYAIEPAAKAWDFVTPGFVQTGIQNFFDNLNVPIVFANNVLQAKPRSAALPETPLNLDILGADDEAYHPWLALRWRFAKNWALNLHYNRFDETGSALNIRDFNIDGTVFPAGTDIESKVRANTFPTAMPRTI